MNGVYVNEKRVRTATLHEGDKLDLGDLSLTFTFLAPQATPHGAPHATAEYSGKETLVLAPDFDSTGIDLDYPINILVNLQCGAPTTGYRATEGTL